MDSNHNGNGTASSSPPQTQDSDTDTDSTSSPEQKVPQGSPNEDQVYSQSFEEFSKFCCLRSIPKDVKTRACYYLQHYIQQEMTPLLPEVKDLYALIIYLAVIETRSPYGPTDPHIHSGTLDPPSISVTDILQMTGVNISKLFQTLNVIKNKTAVPISVLNHLKKMEKNYCVVAALFDTFESRLCQNVFRDSTEDGGDDGYLPPIPKTEGVCYRKRQCWTLFLLSRYHLLQDNQELLAHFQLLLCCVEFVLRQTPSFLLNAPYDSIRFGCYGTQEAGITMLGKLAEEFEVASDGTLQLHLDRTENYFQSLLNKDGELDSDSLTAEYEKIYHREGDLDETQFLTKAAYLMPPQMNKANNQSSTQCKLIPGQMIPVRLAVSTVDLLHKNFGTGPDKPTDKLVQYFQKCTQHPGELIDSLLSGLREKFVAAFEALKTSGDAAVAGQRFSLSLKIYYTVLEALLNTESERLTNQMLTTLLHREDFHKSLLACSLLVVLTTYGQTWNMSEEDESPMSFPWLLDIFSLSAYDFDRVIESFLKAEPRLPVDVVTHFHNVETRILEKEAWKEGSQVFAALADQPKDASQGQVTPPRLASPMASPMKSQPGSWVGHGISRCSLELFLSPVKPGHLSSSSSSSLSSLSTSQPASPSCGSGRSNTPTNDDSNASLPKLATVPRQSQSLARFINRVCRLGFSRLSKLCHLLDCSKELQHKIWTCFEYCVTNMSHLLRNRHLDQIIMCCIYGLCKVTEQEVLFKDIVSVYMEQPHAKLETRKQVFISEGRHESIITFYNQVFMPSVKSYILQFSLHTAARPKLSPMPKQAKASPHHRLPGNMNFTISPLKASPFKAPMSPSKMTPGTKLLYSFPESIGGLDSAEKLKDFKQRLEMRRIGEVSSAKKRLYMDEVAPPGTTSKARKRIF